jgi:hypothetical protein
MKLLVLIIFVGILVSLGSAVRYLISDRSDSSRTVRALTWRIGLSVFLFVLLIVGYKLGWIVPNANTPGSGG